MALEVDVDRARCIGSKSCVHAAPGVFALDDSGVAVVVDPAGAPGADVLAAAEACPTGAITVAGGGPAAPTAA